MAVLPHVLDLLFQSREFGVGLVEATLRIMHSVAGGMVALA